VAASPGLAARSTQIIVLQGDRVIARRELKWVHRLQPSAAPAHGKACGANVGRAAFTTPPCRCFR